MAHALGFTRARISQIMDLLLLAPQVQEEIIFLDCVRGQQPLSERALLPIARLTSWPEQIATWRRLHEIDG